jgi:hypothetical protein
MSADPKTGAEGESSLTKWIKDDTPNETNATILNGSGPSLHSMTIAYMIVNIVGKTCMKYEGSLIVSFGAGDDVVMLDSITKRFAEWTNDNGQGKERTKFIYVRRNI